MPEPVTPTTEPAATPAATTPAAAAPTTPPTWDDLFKDEDPEKVKEALENSRKWERQSKANHEWRQANEGKVAEFDKLAEASKTDQQRLEDAATAARKEADDAKCEAARLRVAVKHGITAEDFDLLGTGTEDELSARAERIVALRGAAAQPSVPKPNPAQGSSASGAPDLESQIAAAKAAGDVTLQIRLQNQKLLSPLK